MVDLVKKYQNICSLYRKIIPSNEISNYFSQEEINSIFRTYNDIDDFINKALDTDEYFKENTIMLNVCQGCPFFNQCSGDKHARCLNHRLEVDFSNIEFVGDENTLKWFYLNTMIYLNDYQSKSKIANNFFSVFKRVKKIKMKKKMILMYSDHFLHYERVKNAGFLSYQGDIVEVLLNQIMYMITGNYYEFYFDNITNETEIKSPIEDKMFKALDNNPYLRKKFKYTLEKQHVITDPLGNILFTLDFLMDFGDKFKLCIECDGYNYHSNPERFELDRRRDRTLLKQGIYTVRFTSHEINYLLEDCISDIIEIVEFHLYNKFYH